MLLLGIESSCDETAGAVVRDGRWVLSNVVASQEKLHRKFGGVVPEIASRAHIERFVPVISEALRRASVGLEEVDGIAVTTTPGLIGALLTGLTGAKALALVAEKPLVSVNHIYAHCYAIHLDNPEPPSYPYVALVASGGHTAIFLCRDEVEIELLGSTTDDAGGEAFDKVAKILGLGYPGGPAIERSARSGNPSAINFPRSLMDSDDFDFSFSGLKTAVLYHCYGQDASSKRKVPEEEIPDISASFQEAVVEVLVEKTLRAGREMSVRGIVVGGGVACNRRLRELFLERAGDEFQVHFPPKKYCTDNACMIAGLGYHLLKRGIVAGLDVDAVPQLIRSRNES